MSTFWSAVSSVMRNFLRIFSLALLLSSYSYAWWHPHVLITRAAVLSLPAPMLQRLGSEPTKNLIEVYSYYPDHYRSAGPQGNSPDASKRTAMRIYCEKPDGKAVHNVTWRRQEDLESLEYVLNGMIAHIRQDEPTKAAQYAGTLAHLLEDSTSPAHAMDLKLVQDLLPPPAGKQGIHLHKAIEITAPEFDLGTRAPRSVGVSVAEAASNLLDRCYAIIRDNRAHLLELVRAVYADDEATMDRLRLRAAMAGAEMLADAYYTAFTLAGDAPVALSEKVPVETSETAPRSSTFESQRRLRLQ